MTFDSDIVFTTPNQILVDGVFRDEPTLDCEGKSADKKPFIIEEDFIKCIYDSFGNKVGQVTNVGSSCYDKISLFEKGTPEYEELDYRIKCIQYYQQECIDSAKNGVPPKPLPGYWTNPRDEMVVINGDEDEELRKAKEFNKRVLVDKKPYYFIYIYPELSAEYSSYIKTINSNSRRRFRMDFEQLKIKQNKTEEEKEFIKWGDIFNPISKNPCIVNKIADIVERNFDDTRVKRDKFDYEIYMNEDAGICRKGQIDLILNAYETYGKAKSNKMTTIKSLNDEEFNMDKANLNSILMLTLKEIELNSYKLANTLVHLSYKRNLVSKWVVWACCGEEILNNMLKKHGNKIKYPIKDENGDILYNGEYFSMREKIIETKGEN